MVTCGLIVSVGATFRGMLLVAILAMTRVRRGGDAKGK